MLHLDKRVRFQIAIPAPLRPMLLQESPVPFRGQGN